MSIHSFNLLFLPRSPWLHSVLVCNPSASPFIINTFVCIPHLSLTLLCCKVSNNNNNNNNSHCTEARNSALCQLSLTIIVIEVATYLPLAPSSMSDSQKYHILTIVSVPRKQDPAS